MKYLRKNSWTAVSSTVIMSITIVLESTAVSAAAQTNDVTHLQNALLTKDALSATDDFDGNGKVNAIDFALMKRELLAQSAQVGEVQDTEWAATAETVKLIGRTLRKDDVTWLVQSGSAVEFTVTGTAASVTVTGDGAVYSDEKYRPRYGIFVDGKLVKDVVMSESSQTIALFSDTKKRTATVKVIHLSEANNGAVGIKTIAVTSDAARPVKPTPKKELSIEFIGDSITCAYGVEAESQNVGFSTGTENFTKSYAYLTAELLDADYSAVSYSGYGIISGYSSDGKANTDSLLPDYYELVGKPQDYAEKWDFAAHPQDVVIVNLGTNDDSYCSKEFAVRAPLYQEEYATFLKTVRQNNPDAYIICTLGIMGCEELYPYLEKAVAAVGDDKISCFQSPTQNMADGLGADWHPSPVTHERNAYLLADIIAQTIGMEWSRIGIDFAADVPFFYQAAEGVNASAYFNEWDQSYSVNTVTGGSKAEDLMILRSPLVLIAGKYELSFRIAPIGKMNIPYQVRSTADAEKVYFEGTIAASDAEQTICETVDMAEADECEIVFFAGGMDSARLMFYDVAMLKCS